MPHKYFCKKDCKFWNNNVVNPVGLENCGKPSGTAVHVVGMDCQSYISSNNIKVNEAQHDIATGANMEINEKTLKAFITKQKKKVLTERRKQVNVSVYNWWCGFQEMLWTLELFVEGAKFSDDGDLL